METLRILKAGLNSCTSMLNVLSLERTAQFALSPGYDLQWSHYNRLVLSVVCKSLLSLVSTLCLNTLSVCQGLAIS